jgi:hypothetical protein
MIAAWLHCYQSAVHADLSQTKTGSAIMNQQPVAIIIAGALIAAAITLTNHWALVAVHSEGSNLMLRLNRWTRMWGSASSA